MLHGHRTPQKSVSTEDEDHYPAIQLGEQIAYRKLTVISAQADLCLSGWTSSPYKWTQGAWMGGRGGQAHLDVYQPAW